MCIMLTSTLTNACHCVNFLGVYPLDQLPTVTNINSKFIVNTHTSNLPGQHWVAVNGRCVFDPCGIYYPNRLCNYLYEKNHGQRLCYNRQSFQNPHSTLCGNYCMYWLHFGTTNLLPHCYKHNDSIILNATFDCV